jgi:hypothetical protein
MNTNRIANRIFSTALIAVMLALVIVIAAHGANVTKTFGWAQAGEDLPYLKEWRLYSATAEGGPYTLAATVPYGGTPQAEYTSAQTITFPDGANTTKWFRLTAVNVENIESVPSNTISVLYAGKPLSVPTLLRIIGAAQ